MEKIYKFDVLIRNQPYMVFDIPDKKHDNGTLWIEFHQYPIDNDIEYIPYNDKDCNNFLWDISINQGNSMNYKFDKHTVETYTFINLKINNDSVYSFYSDSLDKAFHEAKDKIYRLEKLPFDISKHEKLYNRKIYYKGLPATICQHYIVSGFIIIEPDCDEKYLNKWWDSLLEPWFTDKEYNKFLASKDFNKLKVDILDENIHWFRNERKNKIIKILRNKKSE